MRTSGIKNKGTTSLFRNRFLEALTRTHFAIPVLLYLFMSVMLLFYTAVKTELSFWRVSYLFPLGMLVFSFVEYCIHRWVFHFNAKTERQKAFKYKVHGVHHEYPRDKDRLVMPPVLSILVALVFYGLFKLIMGDVVLLFFPGFLAGYSTYLLIHYAIHRLKPPANFLKILWTHHALHHYKSEDAAFGVSFPFWDYLFGTMPPKSDPSINKVRRDLSELL